MRVASAEGEMEPVTLDVKAAVVEDKPDLDTDGEPESVVVETAVVE